MKDIIRAHDGEPLWTIETTQDILFHVTVTPTASSVRMTKAETVRFAHALLAAVGR